MADTSLPSRARAWRLRYGLALLLAAAGPILPQRAWAEEAKTQPTFAAGLDQYYRSQWPEASATFQRLVEADPRDTMSFVYLLHTYLKRNDQRTILYQVEQKVVATDSKDAVALAHLGLGYLTRSLREAPMLDEAQKTFEKALTIDPNLSIAHTGMGLVYYQRRMMPRAKGHFLNALRSNPNDLMAIERAGDIAMIDEKHPSDALSLFGSLTEKAPTYPDGFWYVGSAQYDLERYDRCIENMQKVMDLDPQGLTQGYHAPILMGKAYLKLKKYPEAQAAFQSALKINPGNAEAKYYLEQATNPPKS